MISVKAGGYAPEASTHTRALRYFADELIAVVTDDDDVDVEVIANVMDRGRPSSDLLSMVESGELTLCYFSTSYLGSRVPELEAIEIPFMFEGLEAAHAAMDGAFGAAVTTATERRTGLEVLGYWDNGMRHLTNAIHPIHGPGDLAGMRVRVQPNATHEAMIEAWGGIPVAVELSRGIELLLSGEVEAQENPLANTVAYGVDRVHPHVTMTAHLYGARGVYANPAALAAMPNDLEQAVRAAAQAAIAFQRPAAEAYETEVRAKMTAAGAAFVDLTGDERRSFAAAAEPVAAMARGAVGEAVPWPT